jgi:hypothetical protein
LRVSHAPLETSFVSVTDFSAFFQIGKYWSKDERRQHLEQAKERRRKQLALIEAKNVNTVTANCRKSASPTLMETTGKASPQQLQRVPAALEPVLLSVTTV